MTAKELKAWIVGIPEEFDDYTVVTAIMVDLNVEDYTARPVVALDLDEEHKELLIIMDKDAESA